MIMHQSFLKLAIAAVVAMSATGAVADEVDQDRGKKKARVAIVTCTAESDGLWVFTAGDIDGRRLELSNQTPCSRVLSSLATNGFKLQTPVTPGCSLADGSQTWTAIALAESGGS